MKADFIPKFIKAVIDLGIEMHDMWQWQLLYYKGIRVKGHDYNDFKKAYAGFNNLKNRGLIVERSGSKFQFTKKGQDWYRGALFKYWKSTGQRWDKKWRIVIFDIPQELHNKRNIFRARLKSLGFYMIQKSVFVFPYPCEEELARYCNQLKIGAYMNIILAENVGYIDDEVKKFYNL